MEFIDASSKRFHVFEEWKFQSRTFKKKMRRPMMSLRNDAKVTEISKKRKRSCT